jgi:uncharacterized protein (TIGR00730 family)
MRDHLKEYLDKGRAANVRGLRVLLEYFYAVEQFAPMRNTKIPVVSVFGSARSKPNKIAFKQGYELGRRLYHAGYAVVTGASRGVMEATNQGVSHAIIQELKEKYPHKNNQELLQHKTYKKRLRDYSLGLRISLPFEEKENPWVGSAATFHYFMIRKFFFATLSQAFVACEGGWGTRDELFEMLTLVQTGKNPLMPIIYLSPEPDHLKADLAHSLRLKYIDKEDLHLLNIVKRPGDAVRIISNFYRHVERIKYPTKDMIRIFWKHPGDSGLERRFQSLWKHYSRYFRKYHWRKTRLELFGFNGRSFGVVRQLINKLNA